MIEIRNYAVVMIIVLYALIQFISALFIGIPSSLAIYITFCFATLYALYFYENKQILDWILSIIIPLAILYIVIFIVSSFFDNYTADESIIGGLRYFFMLVLPTSGILFISTLIFKWINDKQNSAIFIKITLFIYFIATFLYALIISFIIGFMVSSSHNTYSDVIATYLFVFTYFFLPLLLTIHAHINKGNIEKYFHLGYMIFAPIIIFYIIPDNSYESNRDSFFLVKTSIIFLIPFIFFLKNCYLSYRHKKLNTLESIEKDLEVSTKVAGEIATQGNLSKGLVNNEEISNLDKFLGFIQCGVASAVVGVVAGAMMGGVEGAIAGVIIGAVLGAITRFLVSFPDFL